MFRSRPSARRDYNYRVGLRADWPRVFTEAAPLDKAVEIDSYVDRQDLSIDLLPMARGERHEKIEGA